MHLNFYLGRCKAQPFNFHRICFLVSLFQCPNPMLFITLQTPFVMVMMTSKLILCVHDHISALAHICLQMSIVYLEPHSACQFTDSYQNQGHAPAKNGYWIQFNPMLGPHRPLRTLQNFNSFTDCIAFVSSSNLSGSLQAPHKLFLYSQEG